jgi:hypothetical protein
VSEEELKPLTKIDIATLAKYFEVWNGTRAWMETHPKSSYNAARASASEWLTKPNIKAAIQDKLAELHMSADDGKNDKETHIIDIELYDRQAALRDILKLHGKFTDKLEIKGGVEMIVKKIGVDIDKV